MEAGPARRYDGRIVALLFLLPVVATAVFVWEYLVVLAVVLVYYTPVTLLVLALFCGGFALLGARARRR